MKLLVSPSLASSPSEPVRSGLSGVEGPELVCPTTWGKSSRWRGRSRPRMPCSSPSWCMRPLFWRGISCHWSSSWLRSIQRQECRPQTCSSCGPKRSWLSGHAELRRPAVRVVGHLAVPDRVPARVPLRLAVAQDQVDLAAAGGQVELEARAPVVVAVEADADDVADEGVAPARVAVHERRVVEGADREVDVLLAVEDLELGARRRPGALGRELLRVVAGPLALLPRRVVQSAVDRRRLAGEPLREVEARLVLAPVGAGRAGPPLARRCRLLGGGGERERAGQTGTSHGRETSGTKRDRRNAPKLAFRPITVNEPKGPSQHVA